MADDPPPSPAVRVILSADPYAGRNDGENWLTRGAWPCAWIDCPGMDAPPAVAAFRLVFDVPEAATVRWHVAADERYELFLDGERIGRGSERGDPDHWYFDTYDVMLAPGRHLLAARVWALGPVAPRSQMSVRPGFLLSPQAEPWIARLGTGVAPWQGRLLTGYEFRPPFPHPFYSIGHHVRLCGENFPWDWERNHGPSGWWEARTLSAGSDALTRTRVGGEPLLRPALLPPLLTRARSPGRVRFAAPLATGTDAPSAPASEGENRPEAVAEWQQLWQRQQPLTILPGESWRVLVDFEDYLCAQPVLSVSGGRGGWLRLHWAESLFGEPEAKTKGDRSQIEGKYFVGVGDEFAPDGGADRLYEPPFWRAGRYLEILVRTGTEPLTINRLTPLESQYPLAIEGALAADDPRWARFTERAIRTLQVSCHDGYMDPYYEQMTWLGDGLQNMLVTFVLSSDDRPTRKLLETFDASRLPSGFTRARHPARDALLIVPYSLYWVMMLRNFALWRGDLPAVRRWMRGARGVLDACAEFLNADGLLEALPGWNFIDWVPAWRPHGHPPEADQGVSAILHWHFVAALAAAAETEEMLGETELAARCRQRAAALARTATEAFWCEERGLFSDGTDHRTFSEHAQTFAVLSGQLAPDRRARVRDTLLTDPDLTRATISFTHHLFEACFQLGCADALFGRMGLWFDLESLGLLTLPEAPEPSRSDCHSWSTHPLYHFVASVLGIRPAGPGFDRVTITPRLGPLREARARIPHPAGMLDVELTRQNGRLRGTVTLPGQVTGVFFSGAETFPLHGGTQTIDCADIRT